MSADPYIRWFTDLTLADLPEVGGKNASLGEMVSELVPLGINVPGGFAVTATAYRAFLDHNGLVPVIRDVLEGLDLDDVQGLQRRGKTLRTTLTSAEMPEAIEKAIREAYAQMGDLVDVAVRSSATAEDLPDASFAGQQETYLNVHGPDDVVASVQRCFASLFTDRAISYRTQRGFDHLAVALSVGVQRMVRSDLAGAGVMFTLDTESGFRDVVLVTAAWGLGETVVQGSVVPDEHLVFKPTLREGFRPIVRRSLGSKEARLVYDSGGSRRVRLESVSPADRERFVLTDDEALELARQAVTIEAHYSKQRGTPTPMDIEWAKDGHTGELFIVQARPETVQSRRSTTCITRFVEKGSGTVVSVGRAVGEAIATGPARVVRSPGDLGAFTDGDILVAEHTDPDWEPVMRRAAAIVTDHGGRTCHAAIVSRELGVPAVVGTGDATQKLDQGGTYTVSCANGEEGRVYEGAVPFERQEVELGELARPRTKILMNVGTPGEAFKVAQIPNDGVGLAREEFIVTASIGIHPRALLEPEAIDDPAVRAQIAVRTRGWRDGESFFVDRLAEGIAQIAAAFHPRPVTLRLSDFKSNEYRGLLGGTPFEPEEENPMIGWRGASRYPTPEWKGPFAMECAAIRRVRDEMGLRNLRIMVPFCRTLDEGRGVLEALATHGLVQGENGLEVWVMCEIPSNALLSREFGELFDGLSIGSNDLTQLTLGVDRSSERLAAIFDENDPAVRKMIELAIEGAHAAGVPIGICGQAPSDHPEFAAWLVAAGIDSLSLTPDAVLPVTARVLELEE